MNTDVLQLADFNVHPPYFTFWFTKCEVVPDLN